MVLFHYKHKHPDRFARLLEQSTPEERAEIERRIKRLEEQAQ